MDLLKGFTALLMVFSHVATSLRGSSPVVDFLLPFLLFIDITTFTTLFFLSGSGMYLLTLRYDISEAEFALVKPKIFKKGMHDNV